MKQNDNSPNSFKGKQLESIATKDSLLKIKNPSVFQAKSISPKNAQQDLLFSSDMISVEIPTQHRAMTATLSPEHVNSLVKQSSELKFKENQKRYKIQEKLKEKSKLEAHFKQIQRLYGEENIFTEQRLLKMQEECVVAEDTICFAEMDNIAYKNMLSKEQYEKLMIAKRIEDLKKKLKKADDLASEAVGVKKCADQRKQEEEEKTNCQEDLKNINELRKKIENGRKTLENINKEISESQKRIDNVENNIINTKLRNEKHVKRIEKLRENVHKAVEMKRKFEIFQKVFEKQYNDLKATYNTTARNEILSKKDSYDIVLQTERNCISEKIELLKSKKEILYRLECELENAIEESFKQQKMLMQQKTMDSGEYNSDARAMEYVRGKEYLEEKMTMLEEKLGFVRKIISGVKHILYTLQGYDQDNETGKWHNLQEVAAIDEISNSGTLQKFSRLLLMLEEKINSVNFLISQKIQHQEIIKNSLTASEKAEYSPPIILNISHIEKCREILENFLNNRGTYAGVAVEKDQDKQNQEKEEPVDINDDDLGKYIVENKIIKKSEVLNLKAADDSPALEKEKKVEMPELSEQAFDIRRRKRNRLIFIDQAIKTEVSPEEISAYEQEQVALLEKFKKGRLNIKIGNAIKSHHMLGLNSTQSLQGNGQKSQKKKKLTNLTLEVSRAMKKRPSDVVEAATETFDTLYKIRKFDDERLRKELAANQKSFPNFLGVILNLKKSRNDEEIGKIAAKCNYFVEKPLTALGSTRNYMGSKISNASVRNKSNYNLNRQTTDTAADMEEFVMGNMQKRIKNLHSLDRLEQWPTNSVTAFDTFCIKEKEDIPLSVLKRNSILDNPKRPQTSSFKYFSFIIPILNRPIKTNIKRNKMEFYEDPQEIAKKIIAKIKK